MLLIENFCSSAGAKHPCEMDSILFGMLVKGGENDQPLALCKIQCSNIIVVLDGQAKCPVKSVFLYISIFLRGYKNGKINDRLVCMVVS